MTQQVQYDTGLATLYSNFDHTLNEAVLEIITEQPFRAGEHTAWEFHGVVWFDGKLWYEEVSRYHSVVATYTGESALDVIEQANDDWGHE